MNAQSQLLLGLSDDWGIIQVLGAMVEIAQERERTFLMNMAVMLFQLAILILAVVGLVQWRWYGVGPRRIMEAAPTAATTTQQGLSTTPSVNVVIQTDAGSVGPTVASGSVNRGVQQSPATASAPATEETVHDTVNLVTIETSGNSSSARPTPFAEPNPIPKAALAALQVWFLKYLACGSMYSSGSRYRYLPRGTCRTNSAVELCDALYFAPRVQCLKFKVYAGSG